MKEAVNNYQAVVATSQDIQLEKKSLYNIGNCRYRQGRLEEAVEYYKQALDLDPQDQDAKYNLEFVREEIKKRINQAKQREKQQKKKNREKDEKKQKAQDQQQQPKEEQQKKQQEQQPKTSKEKK